MLYFENPAGCDPVYSDWFGSWRDAEGISCQRQTRTCRVAKFTSHKTVLFLLPKRPSVATCRLCRAISVRYLRTRPRLLAQDLHFASAARSGRGAGCF